MPTLRLKQSEKNKISPEFKRQLDRIKAGKKILAPRIIQTSQKLTLAEMAKMAGRKRLKRPPRPPAVKSLELAYYRKLKAYAEAIKRLTKKTIATELSKVVSTTTGLLPTADRFDDNVEDLIKRLRLKVGQIYPDAVIEQMAKEQAEAINKSSKGYFSRFAEQVAGVNPIRSEAWLKTQVETFTKYNVSLIKSIADDHLKRIEGIVATSVQQGKSLKTITEAILEKVDMPLNRAKLIARDQTAKFNAALAKSRQTELGLTQYIWLTSRDERVRDSHRICDGHTFTWDQDTAIDDPSIEKPDGNNPGEDFQCRCQALAVIEEAQIATQEPEEE